MVKLGPYTYFTWNSREFALWEDRSSGLQELYACEDSGDPLIRWKFLSTQEVPDLYEQIALWARSSYRDTLPLQEFLEKLGR